MVEIQPRSLVLRGHLSDCMTDLSGTVILTQVLFLQYKNNIMNCYICMKRTLVITKISNTSLTLERKRMSS